MCDTGFMQSSHHILLIAKISELFFCESFYNYYFLQPKHILNHLTETRKSRRSLSYV